MSSIIQGGKYLVTVTIRSPIGIEGESIVLLSRERATNDNIMDSSMRKVQVHEAYDAAMQKVQVETKERAEVARFSGRMKR